MKQKLEQLVSNRQYRDTRDQYKINKDFFNCESCKASLVDSQNKNHRAGKKHNRSPLTLHLLQFFNIL